MLKKLILQTRSFEIIVIQHLKPSHFTASFTFGMLKIVGFFEDHFGWRFPDLRQRVKVHELEDEGVLEDQQRRKAQSGLELRRNG